MELTRSGDVLAGRYRLVDLLSEARDGRFWRAEDGVLGRPVAIHVLAADDERAPRLAVAARASAAVNDTRMLRVLDVASDDQIAYVVSEWGTGTSLDNLLAADGPLPPRRAAWLAAEVTDLLTKAHALGHAHGRLNPENVLLDDLGAVRVIGFAVEAALYGLEPNPQADIKTDCVDAAGILYAGLTAKWAGRTDSHVPSAPTGHGRPLRPRQVRAGVPRLLDDLCDGVLRNGDGALTSAREQHDLLAAYVGDPSAFARPTRATSAIGTTIGTIDVPAVPEGDDAPTITTPATEQTAAEQTAVAEAEESPPTEPGLPAFEAHEYDHEWTKPREDPAPPPPLLEPPPPKPLFTDEPRRPRAGAEQSLPSPAVPPPAQLAPEPGGRPAGYWPFSGAHPRPDTEELEKVPGRRWLRLAIGVAVAAILVVCVALAVNGTQGRGPFARNNSGTRSAPSPTPSAAPALVRGLTVRDFDPYGDPPNEYPDLVHLAHDGDPATTWRTSTYRQQFGPDGLKPGLGLILDLKETYAVDKVHLDLVGQPTGVSIYVSDRAPTEAPSGTPAATATLDASGDVMLHGAPRGRFVTVWITRLPAVSDGFRAEVGEVSVTGSKVG